MSYRTTSFMGSITPMVRLIIIISAACFFLDGISRGALSAHFSLYPPLALTKGWVWQFVTYIFLHGDIWHLLFNMLALWMFGSSLERLWGGPRFLQYFLVTGIGAGIISAILDFSSPPIIGSSGSIYGILVAFAITFPEVELLVFFLFSMKAKHYCIIFAAIELYFSLSSPGSSVAHIAHLGGMAVGFFMLKPPGALLNKFTAKQKWPFSSSKPRHLTIVSSPQETSKTTPAALDDELQLRVDNILDKIRVHGMQALSLEERNILEKARARLKEQKEDL